MHVLQSHDTRTGVAISAGDEAVVMGAETDVPLVERVPSYK